MPDGNDVRGLLARNGAANLVRNGSTSLLTIGLPMVLVFVLGAPLYAVWAVVFSIGSYLAFLDAGVPTTVQALIARAAASRAEASMRRAAFSGLAVTGAVVGLFVGVSAVLAAMLGAVVPSLDPSLRTAGGFALVLITLGQGATLMSNAANGYFAGLQRSGVSTVVLAPARLVSFVAAVVTAATTRDLVGTALAYAAPLVVGLVIMISLIDRETRSARHAETDRAFGVVGVIRYSGPLIVWSVCSLAASGFATLLVARFAYDQLVPFSLAMVVVTALTGFMSAVSGPLLPQFAGTHAQREAEVGRQILLATRIHSAVLNAVALCAVALLPLYLAIVLAEDDVASAWQIALLLVVAAVAQMSSTPLALGFIATRTHSRLVAPPVISSAVSLGAGLALAGPWGAYGVALGMLAGSLLGTVLTCLWSIRRVRIAGLAPAAALRWTLGLPIWALVIVAAASALALLWANPVAAAVTAVILVIPGILWEVLVIVPRAERERLAQLLRRRR